MPQVPQTLTKEGTYSELIPSGGVVRIDPNLRTANGQRLGLDEVDVCGAFLCIHVHSDPNLPEYGTFEAQNISDADALLTWSVSSHILLFKKANAIPQTDLGPNGVNPSAFPPIILAAMGLAEPFLHGVLLVTPTSTTPYPDISSAIAASNAGDTIYLGAGVYPYTGPVPNNIAISGGGSNGQAVIQGELTLGENSRIFGVNIEVPAGGVGVTYSGFIYAALQNCNFTGDAGSVGFRLNSPTGTLLVSTIGSYGPLETLASVINGNLVATNLFGLVGTLGSLIHATGGNISLFESRIQATCLANYALRLGASSVRLFDCDWDQAITAVYIEADGHSVTAKSCVFEPRSGGGGFSFEVAPLVTSGDLEWEGCTLRESTVNITPAYAVNVADFINFFDPDAGEQRKKYYEDVSVGRSDKPRTFETGYGSAQIRGMIVKRNTNLEAGAWSDITAEVRLNDGTTVAPFSALTAGAAFYVGYDLPYPSFCGIEWKPTAALVHGVGGSIICEYWDGVAWTPLNTMATKDSSPYLSYGNRLFERAQDEHVRTQVPSAWATKTLDGSTKYWMRFRVSGAGLLSAGLVEQIRVSTSRTAFNANGLQEMFGEAEPQSRWMVDLALTREVSGATASNQNINFSPLMNFNLSNNRASNGTLTRLGQIIQVPEWADTSRRLTVALGFRGNGVSAGNVPFRIYADVVEENDVLLGGLPDTLRATKTFTFGAGEDNLQKFFEIELFIPEFQTGEFVRFVVERDGPAGDDTYSGAIDFDLISLKGSAWRI